MIKNILILVRYQYKTILTLLLMLLLIIFIYQGNNFTKDNNLQTNESNNITKQTKNNNLIQSTVIPGNNKLANNGINENIVPSAEIAHRKAMMVDEHDMMFGDINSKIVVIVYLSPVCYGCAYYYKNIYPKIKEQYINTNKILYIPREFVSNSQEFYASVLARCIGDTESYLRFMNVIFNRQFQWAFSKNYKEILYNIAQIGLVPKEQFKNCIIANQNSDSPLIKKTHLLSKFSDFGVVPVLIINGEQYDFPHNIREWNKIIDEKLNKNS
ncbi:thioredoxin domain-containing protein [Rickettsia endosymbiont of Cardiosporidium cionae]|uniref:thioredoxin domain-containing protein n=1 Tax=Rickettsia endosymbiont of Cardiosporidium cionae TaxID=2777155 RepID=UPI0018937A82|nr:thioredoxin domain-containing protein [Rickettsia endosymbiont of Cardiosporidium cionae]KAF8818587.1 hypothetical protein IHI24_000305 [Rickettsia endosymbiont of Cardiosporidium cionae]